MNAEESVKLCRYVKACCPQQAIDELTPLAWADHLEDYPYADAKEAAKEITAKQAFVTIAELLVVIRRIRASRIEDHPALTPPRHDCLSEDCTCEAFQRAWLKDARRRIADGEHVDSTDGYGELRPRNLPDLKALIQKPPTTEPNKEN